MAVSRAQVVDQAFTSTVLSWQPSEPRSLDLPLPGREVSGRELLELMLAQFESRHLDFLARSLKNRGQSFYTIGSSGHEGNAAVAAATTPADPAFLHYRSGAFYLARARQHGGTTGPLDVLLGLVASKDEPIAGGRHKVFGSVELNIPPQTSTIASHLPKAVGCALSLDRKARLERRREDRLVVCTFGDASINHASAVTAFNAACWATHQHIPVPLLLVCEDNGIGISVPTPRGWVASQYAERPGLKYFFADGLDLGHATDVARQAAQWVRTHRRPALLHLRTVRLLGHAGSDVEQTYRTLDEIRATEALDPLIQTARLVVEAGLLAPADVVALYEDTRNRLTALAEEAVLRPKLTTRAEVMEPLSPFSPAAFQESLRDLAAGERVWSPGEEPEADPRPRHLAVQINRAMTDLFAAVPHALLFGEDVARKGGVYNVTTDLYRRFGPARVFNTLLDETSILGLALGAAHAGLLPFPEVQYLAYLMNAIDQLRGEAGSLSFFSNGQYANPMVLRVAGLAYQKGFGGHFHNDNGIAALREIPSLVVACPANGADAVRALRTLTALAQGCGRTTVLLEPIALYMTKDLHEPGDNGWLTPYPPQDEHWAPGEVGCFVEPPVGAPRARINLVSFANGLFMSRRVARRLAQGGVEVTVVDLRWLQPLPLDALHAALGQRPTLLVDECRRSSGVGEALWAGLAERDASRRLSLVTGADSYIPLADAANLVLLQEDEIEEAARRLLGGA